MKKMVIAAALAASIGSVCVMGTAFNVGISANERGINGFSLSIGEYYGVPYQNVRVIGQTIPRDELSVVYYLSDHAHMDPRFIVQLRQSGLSWWDITLRLGLDPYGIYVVTPVYEAGPPYGVAYGYRKPGKAVRLHDRDIVDLVNVRFLSGYHRVSVDEIIQRRRSGERFMNINDYYRSRHIHDERRQEGYRDRDRYRERPDIREQDGYHERMEMRERDFGRGYDRYDDGRQRGGNPHGNPHGRGDEDRGNRDR